MRNALVDTNWVADHIDDPKVRLIEIDWEGRNAYDEAHIPGAVGFNWKTFLWDATTREFPSPEEFASRLAQIGISNNTTVVFYGVPIQFGTYAWWVFNYLGHDNVCILDGGLKRWERDGRSVTSELPVVSRTNYQPTSRNESIRALRDSVLNAIEDANVIIADHRSNEEYHGLRVGLPGKPDVGAERYGRIPGARHVPFDSLLNDDDTFKPNEELRAILEEQDLEETREIVSYCRLSHRATLAFFVMTQLLGYRNVRVYDGSWTEWGSLVGVPIEK